MGLGRGYTKGFKRVKSKDFYRVWVSVQLAVRIIWVEGRILYTYNVWGITMLKIGSLGIWGEGSPEHECYRGLGAGVKILEGWSRNLGCLE